MYKNFLDIYKITPSEHFFQNRIGENILLQDFFNTMFLIYFTDIKKKRKNGEKLELIIEVDDVEKFTRIGKKIEELVKFMSYENWKFKFIKRESEKKMFDLFDEEFEVVALLSGGLDSFTGTYYNKDRKTKYIGFNLNSSEQKSQKEITKLIEGYNNGSKFKSHKLSKRKKNVLTQRTRSLFFFALGIVEAYLSKVKKLNIYENGIMSLNPSLNYSRQTTKTTHPKTLYMFNEILRELGIDIELENTCVNRTKAQMISDLPEEYLRLVEKTTTCGVNRQKISFDNKKYTHCGACVPCILRKITLAANKLEYLDKEKYQISYDQSISKKFRPENVKIDLFNEYKSAIMYFNNFRKAIENKEVFKYLETLKKYYNDTSYFQRDEMLDQFKKELDIFFERHPNILGKE